MGHYPQFVEEWVNTLKQKIINHFRVLLQETGDYRPPPLHMNLIKLEEEEGQGLEVQFSEDDIFNALMELGKDKALGLDGYTIEFGTFNWKTIKRDVRLFRGILFNQKIHKSLKCNLTNADPQEEGCYKHQGFYINKSSGEPIQIIGQSTCKSVEKAYAKNCFDIITSFHGSQTDS